MAKSVSFGEDFRSEWRVKSPLLVINMESKEFIFDKCRWKLSMYSDKTYINVALHKMNSEKLIGTYKVKCFAEDKNEDPVKPFVHNLDDLDFVSKEVWYITKNELGLQDKYMTNGTLTFIIIIKSNKPLKDEINKKVSDQSIQTVVNMDTVASLENLSLDLQNLMEDSSEADMTLECEEQSFRAHKNILSARSQVFSAMFRSEMAESCRGIIEITDMDKSILEQFLRYLYSGKLFDLSVDTACDLYVAADKYAIESLKELCAKFIKENLSRENVCKILVIADNHGDTDLKDCALRFIMNIELLRDKDIWFEFLNEHPKLACEVIHHMYEMKCSSNQT